MPNHTFKASRAFKLVATFAAAIAVTLGAGALPANAWVDYRPSHHVDAVETATLGVAFDVDYSCSNGATNDGLTYGFNSGSMPPGLDYDTADGHIKGTPTQAGDYELPFVICGHDGFGEGFSIGHIVVQPPATPTPAVTAINLNDENCNFKIVATFPATPDAGTATITISNPGATIVATLATVTAGSLVEIEVPSSSLTSISNDVKIASTAPVNGGNWDQCESTLDVTVSYQYQGAPAATASAEVHPTRGVTMDSATPCALGTFSATGHGDCTNAPKGSFVATTGATSATACPAGQTTLLVGARSRFECFKVITQTVKAIKVPAKSKFGAKVLTPKTTDLGAPLTLTASGSCSVKSIKTTVVVKGKKTSASRYQVTMSTKAGTCALTYVNAGDESHTAITSVKRIKVSKTGK
ncbi:MAG: Tyrosine-protein kinase ephrin type receptor-like [Actinomycetota bacterium]|jgi:hypothetical protein